MVFATLHGENDDLTAVNDRFSVVIDEIFDLHQDHPKTPGLRELDQQLEVIAHYIYFVACDEKYYPSLVELVAEPYGSFVSGVEALSAQIHKALEEGDPVDTLVADWSAEMASQPESTLRVFLDAVDMFVLLMSFDALLDAIEANDSAVVIVVA